MRHLKNLSVQYVPMEELRLRRAFAITDPQGAVIAWVPNHQPSEFIGLHVAAWRAYLLAASPDLHDALSVHQKIRRALFMKTRQPSHNDTALRSGDAAMQRRRIPRGTPGYISFAQYRSASEKNTAERIEAERQVAVMQELDEAEACAWEGFEWRRHYERALDQQDAAD